MRWVLEARLHIPLKNSNQKSSHLNEAHSDIAHSHARLTQISTYTCSVKVGYLFKQKPRYHALGQSSRLDSYRRQVEITEGVEDKTICLSVILTETAVSKTECRLCVVAI